MSELALVRTCSFYFPNKIMISSTRTLRILGNNLILEKQNKAKSTQLSNIVKSINVAKLESAAKISFFELSLFLLSLFSSFCL